MVDAKTQLDNQSDLLDKKIPYNYTVVNYAIEKLNLEQLRRTLRHLEKFQIFIPIKIPMVH